MQTGTTIGRLAGASALDEDVGCAWTTPASGSSVPIAEHGVPLYTDARHYTAAGIPTVLYGAGPRTLGESHGHAADEQLRLSDLRNATATVACSLASLLGAEA